MGSATENIFANVPERVSGDEFVELLSTPNLRIERIVSTGHVSPAGEWYDQDWAEWVVVLKGSARLHFEGEDQSRLLGPGDYIHIPAHSRHRVEWTAPDEPTVWLAVHYHQSDDAC
jgi:cupin 2 domain-containing protein